VEAERLKNRVALRPDYAENSKLLSGRRASEKIVSKLLKKSGLDMEMFEALQEQRSFEQKRIIEKHKTDALQRVSHQKDALHSSIIEQSKALRALAVRGDFSPIHPSVWIHPF